ncbi:mechanosensitive ion channel domain-containing protein [Posidoniimonas corsicana]|uniref:mechanosensitive ion channel domain-containing protein n=1 Tax=Posidoniimonas corsicana TaxID=1938618 RepID=UPI0018D4D1FB|nr:mechanosensitive ion channel domain-containing protein [Posidoniimonas corsicana]
MRGCLPTPRTADACGLRLLVSLLTVVLLAAAARAQDAADPPPAEPEASAEQTSPQPKDVTVEPRAEDEQIAERLQGILEATGWFRAPVVRVQEGVAFLEGATETDQRSEWAQRLAGRTEDVVAVVNNIEVDTPSLFDFSAANSQLEQMLRGVIQAAPTFLVAVAVLLLTWLAAKVAGVVGRAVANRRVENELLRGMAARFAAVPVLLLGAYLALRVAGLTRLAATVLGGTGLLGIVIGIAFRDIAENYLASILISMRRPFEVGDLVTINEHQGFVQTVTSRGTQIMTLDGNHVQIPNSLVYKSVIENASANPNVRLGFVVGIDYSDSAPAAQDAVLKTLRDHDAVLKDPEPLVLVNELAASTVNLSIYFWVDASKYSHIKVRSAIMRLVKRRLQRDGFTLPDEAREMIFPQGVPVRMIGADAAAGAPPREPARDEPRDQPAALAEADEPEPESTEAEGNLTSEKQEIEQQAAGARKLSDAANLIESPADSQSGGT